MSWKHYGETFVIKTVDGVQRFPEAKRYGTKINEKCPSFLHVYESDGKVATVNLQHVIGYSWVSGESDD